MNADQLYQEVILDHNKNPRNFKKIDDATHCSLGTNPLCGDTYEVYLKIENNIIENIGFKGVGCAISKASASIMTTMIKGKTIDEALSLKECFINLVTKSCDGACDTCLGRLKIFENVKKYPVRVKCATLIWRALENALKQKKDTVTTED